MPRVTDRNVCLLCRKGQARPMLHETPTCSSFFSLTKVPTLGSHEDDLGVQIRSSEMGENAAQLDQSC